MKNVPFKRFLVNRNGGMWGSEPGSDEFDVLCIRVADFDYENLKTKASASTVRSITEKQLQKNQLHDGDILLEKSGGGEKTPVGRAVYYSGNDDAICSNFIERLTVNQQTLNPKFACYILSAAYSQRKNLDCIKQTTGIQNLSVDDYLSSVTIPLFDIETQKRITKWLDKQLSKVAQVITAKQAQLQKLSTYRQSLITRAVTKGLDPNVEMKDSGVEWIGDIPKHWHVCKLKHAGYSFNGLTYSPNDLLSDGIPVLRSCNVQNAKLDLSDTVFVSKEQAHDAMLAAGDVLICSRNGSAKLIGKCAYISQSEKYAFGAFMMVYRSLLKKFGYYLLNSDLFRYYKPLFSTTTINQLTSSTFGDFFIPLPPEMERVKISESLDKEFKKIDSLSRKVDQIILKLKEYRSSLISAAVTGQLAIEEAAE